MIGQDFSTTAIPFPRFYRCFALRRIGFRRRETARRLHRPTKASLGVRHTPLRRSPSPADD